MDAVISLSPVDYKFCASIVGADAECVMLSGSYARGWEHLHSDVDVIVIGDGTHDGQIVRRVHYLDGRQWEVEFFPPAFVDALIGKVAQDMRMLGKVADHSTLDSYELGKALKLGAGVPLSGADSATSYQLRLRAAGLGQVVAQLAAARSDAAIDDALGLLATGDTRSAVLAAVTALEGAIDACLAHHGELTPGAKWRYRKYQALAARMPGDALVMDAQSCWNWLTAAEIGSVGMERWVRNAVNVCQGLIFGATTAAAQVLDTADVPFLDSRDLSLPAAETGAVAVVINPEGIVLHLRDDKPGIPNPGRWSLFGGATDPGELAHETILRELGEELGLSQAQCRPVWRLFDHVGDGRLLTVFEALTPVATSEMTLAEGQDFRAFTLAEALELPLAPFCRQVLAQYVSD